jgi:aspartate/methionine/tyrosine aminotransferase
MVTKGINHALWTCIRSLDCTHVIIPSWAPYVVPSFALAESKELIEAPLDLHSGNFDLEVLEKRIQATGATKGKMLMYMTLPSMPPGTVPEERFIEEKFIPFLRNKGIFVISDSYVFTTTFENKRIRPLLSYKGAKDVAVEAITVSKEIGLPGVRAGGIAGNSHPINHMRIHAASMVDIISSATQNMAAAAFEQINPAGSATRIRQEVINEILPRFDAMNWPIVQPQAGIDMLVAVPPQFIENGAKDPSLLAAFSILRRFGVALCPASVYGPDGKYFLRLVLKQSNKKIPRALDHLVQQGFQWNTDKPSEEDIAFLENRLASLDLTKL